MKLFYNLQNWVHHICYDLEFIDMYANFSLYIYIHAHAPPTPIPTHAHNRAYTHKHTHTHTHAHTYTHTHTMTHTYQIFTVTVWSLQLSKIFKQIKGAKSWQNSETSVISMTLWFQIKGVVLVRAQYCFYVFIWLGKNKNFVVIFRILAEKRLNFKMVAMKNDLNFILTMKNRLL